MVHHTIGLPRIKSHIKKYKIDLDVYMIKQSHRDYFIVVHDEKVSIKDFSVAISGGMTVWNVLYLTKSTFKSLRKYPTLSKNKVI